MKSLTYLLVDLGCIIIPLIASFYPKHPFYKEWKSFFAANFIVGLGFIIWDYFFTKNGIWGFNSDYLTGIYFLNLPIEEILFFICIPYACVFTFFAIQYLMVKNPLANYTKRLSLILIIGLGVIGIVSINKWYTSSTFILTSIYILHRYINKDYLSWEYLSYLIIFPFFLLSNGLLTGSFIESPIVWYNDAENLGIRIWTIPVEDSMYGMLLIFLNISFYKRFKSAKGDIKVTPQT